jgi:hypothetical protein
MQNNKGLKSISILKKAAFFVISAILFLVFLDTLKFLLLAALVSMLIIGFQSLYQKFAHDNIKEKISSIFSVLDQQFDENDKSLKNTILMKMQKVKNHSIFSTIIEFFNSISNMIFQLISSNLSRFVDLTQDQDNFTEKGFPSKKVLLKKSIYLFLILSVFVIAIQIILNIIKIASFGLTFTIKALCVLLPIAGLILFIAGIFHSLNKEKHDLIRDIKNYLIRSDEKTALGNFVKNEAQKLLGLAKDRDLNKDQIQEQLNKANTELNQTFDQSQNDELKAKIIQELEKTFFINGEENPSTEKLNKFNNYELKQIQSFLNKINEQQQNNVVQNEEDDYDIINNASDTQLQDQNSQQPANTKLNKLLEAINNKLTPEHQNEITEKISETYYFALEKAYNLKNCIKEKI